MKILILLAIGAAAGYYIGIEDVTSIGEFTDIVTTLLQTITDKIGEYND